MYVLYLIIEFASNFEFFGVKNTTKFSNKIAKVCNEVCIGEILSVSWLVVHYWLYAKNLFKYM